MSKVRNYFETQTGTFHLDRLETQANYREVTALYSFDQRLFKEDYERSASRGTLGRGCQTPLTEKQPHLGQINELGRRA
jgi:hypothetical protein